MDCRNASPCALAQLARACGTNSSCGTSSHEHSPRDAQASPLGLPIALGSISSSVSAGSGEIRTAMHASASQGDALEAIDTANLE